MERFSDENFYRLSQNLSIDTRLVKNEQIKNDLNNAIEMMSMYHQKFEDQFNIGARSCCPNPECKCVYTYFYDDFKFCPRCGAELIKEVKTNGQSC